MNNTTKTKLDKDGVITITDSNGKSIKFTATQEIDLNAETALGSKEATTENI